MDELFVTPQEKIEQVAKELEPCWFILDTHATREAGWNGGNSIRREKCHRLRCSVCGAISEEAAGYFKHGAETKCTKCHRKGEIVNPRIYKKANVRARQKNAVIITVENPESVWVEGITFYYSLFKNMELAFTDATAGKVALLHFTPGKAEKWNDRYDWRSGSTYIKSSRASAFAFYTGSYFSGIEEADCEYFGLEQLKKTFLKYLPLENTRGSCREFTEILVRYCKWPVWTELCLKTRNYSALKDSMSSRAINRRGKCIDEVFQGLTKEKKKLLFSYLNGMLDLHSDDIAAAYSMLKNSSAEAFRRTTELFKRYACTYAFEVISSTGLSPVRVSNYMEKQKADIRIYRDYINECRKLGYPLDDESVLFPKNLIEKHAETSLLCRYSVSAAEQEKSRKRHDKLVKMGLELSSGTLTVRVPIDGNDIIAEGAKLSHCVGGYATKHANGRTTILFIRKKSDPDTPYFTLEIDVETGKIRQCYGYKNKESYKTTPAVARICGKLTQKIQECNKINERQEKTA